MDIIIEGILTKEEGMSDLLETIIHLKTVPNALLRISSKEEHLKGRIGFGPGGYVLGGCIDDTGELGYTAIKKLLSIRSGNYAVLDTGRDHPPEINQTLWIKGEKILEIWPNLPETPEPLLDVNSNLLSALQSPISPKITTSDREQSISRVRFTAIEVEKKNPHRKRNLSILLSTIVIMLLVLLVVVIFSDKIITSFQKFWLNW